MGRLFFENHQNAKAQMRVTKMAMDMMTAANVQELEGSGRVLHELEANAVRKSRMFRRSWM